MIRYTFHLTHEKDGFHARCPEFDVETHQERREAAIETLHRRVKHAMQEHLSEQWSLPEPREDRTAAGNLIFVTTAAVYESE